MGSIQGHPKIPFFKNFLSFSAPNSTLKFLKFLKKIQKKNTAPHVFTHSTPNFDPIFKRQTILESWRVDYHEIVKKNLPNFLTNEKWAPEYGLLQEAVSFYLSFRSIICFSQKTPFLYYNFGNKIFWGGLAPKILFPKLY